MHRRSFLAALVGVVAAPLAAGAQQAGKVWRIGMLMPGPGPESALALPQGDALVQGLYELGYVEGKNFAFESRYARGNSGRLPDMAIELVRLNVDIILAGGTAAILSAKRATDTIPIVTTSVADPVEKGIVDSLARPGANVTGFALIGWGIASKRLQLLKEVRPQASRLAILYEQSVYPPQYRDRFLSRLRSEGQSLGVALDALAVDDIKGIENAFDHMTRERLDGVTFGLDNLFYTHRLAMVALSATRKLPSVGGEKPFAEAGGLMAYNADILDLWKRAAIYVDKIFRGARPGDLPVQQPTKFDLVINLKTAKALGLTIPPSLLLRADQVIE